MPHNDLHFFCFGRVLSRACSGVAGLRLELVECDLENQGESAGVGRVLEKELKKIDPSSE